MKPKTGYQKFVGCTIRFMGRESIITGKIIKVGNGIATIEHRVVGEWETFTALLPINDPKVLTIIEEKPE